MTYSIVRYRSGSRFVVILAKTDDAGAEVVFGPASEEQCAEYVRVVTHPVFAALSPAARAGIAQRAPKGKA